MNVHWFDCVAFCRTCCRDMPGHPAAQPISSTSATGRAGASIALKSVVTRSCNLLKLLWLCEPFLISSSALLTLIASFQNGYTVVWNPNVSVEGNVPPRFAFTASKKGVQQALSEFCCQGNEITAAGKTRCALPTRRTTLWNAGCDGPKPSVHKVDSLGLIPTWSIWIELTP